jgi:fructose-1,6-bisphosphatase
VFEVAPIAMIIELAGGKAVAPIPGIPPTRILDIDIETVNDRIGIICGSESDVYECLSSIYQQS